MKLTISAVIGIACLGAAVQSQSRAPLHLSAGDGFVNVYQQKTPDTYEAFAQMPTGPGARNSRFVPEQNRLYIAVPA